MKKKIKIAIFVLVVVVVLVTIFLVYGINKKVAEANKNKTNNTISNEIDIVLDSTINDALNSTTDKTSNENITNVENINTTNTQPTTPSEETNITNPEEKAIEIVKKDWGTDNNVYFSFDGINSDGKYIIGVRDKETTYVKHWYDVDLQTEKFTIRTQ